jgi:cytidine deaminase
MSPGLSDAERDSLIAAARAASRGAYAPYSKFHVGAALLFADRTVVAGANAENASYGLSLCAETIAVAKAMTEGRRTGLVAVAVIGGAPGVDGEAIAGAVPVTPCGRCRQVLNELAQLGRTDPMVLCIGEEAIMETTLAALLPHAFGPASLD